MTPAESRALMQRELDEQSELLAIAAGRLSETAAAIRPARDRPIWAGGCGDSLFAAQALARHFRRLGWDFRPASAAEMLWEADIRADTVVGVSISGSTRRTVEAVAAATAKGARTIAVTRDPASALALAATDRLLLRYDPISRAIPHGLDYHVTLLALASLAGEIDPTAVRRLFEGETPRLLREARAIAKRLSPNARYFFLGCGAGLGSADYGAAKMHEAGGLSAWSFEAENFAHGAQFMLRPGDHAVLCGSGGPGDARTEALRAGLERLGVTVGTAGMATADDEPLSVALRAGLALQTFCLAVAEVRDLDVTDPGRATPALEVQRDWFGWTSA